jgi:hypothetical protein
MDDTAHSRIANRRNPATGTRNPYKARSPLLFPHYRKGRQREIATRRTRKDACRTN